MKYLFKNFPLAIILMIAILIMLFKDYRKPAIILCCVPLLAIGIVGAMLLSGQSFTFCAIVGALGLVGMMMKNCIVLMDEIGEQISAGIAPAEALVSSSESRLRPVMMASLTTILGMIPLLSDAMFGSMAATIMGGLLFSTLATLFFVPILYAMFFKIKIFAVLPFACYSQTVLTLDECIRLAKENNKRMEVSEQQLQASLFEKRSTKALFLPSLSLTGNALYSTADGSYSSGMGQLPVLGADGSAMK